MAAPEQSADAPPPTHDQNTGTTERIDSTDGGVPFAEAGSATAAADPAGAFPDRVLWDLVDDISFWIKDRQGRFIWVNQALAAQAHAPRERISGTFDSDWFSHELAAVFMEDDARVVRSGKPIVNKPELVMPPEGGVAWYVTSKFPFRDESGRIQGTFGMTRQMEGDRALPADYRDLSEIVTYAQANIARGLTVASLARAAGMSVSTLERQLTRHLHIGPRDLLRRIRMNRARHLLTTSSLRIEEIARQCGYESFSSFSRAFRRNFRRSPTTLRSESISMPGAPEPSGQSVSGAEKS